MNESRSQAADEGQGDVGMAGIPRYVPLYVQIKRLLTQGLQAGEWKPGEAIPSEMELARRYGVSQGTVRKAIDELAAENLVVRRQGRGTFVATHHEARTQFRFLRLPQAAMVFDALNGQALTSTAQATLRLELRFGETRIVRLQP